MLDYGNQQTTDYRVHLPKQANCLESSNSNFQMPQKSRTSELRQVGADYQPTISPNAIASSQSENENAINITNNYYLIFRFTREEVSQCPNLQQVPNLHVSSTLLLLMPLQKQLIQNLLQ